MCLLGGKHFCLLGGTQCVCLKGSCVFVWRAALCFHGRKHWGCFSTLPYGAISNLTLHYYNLFESWCCFSILNDDFCSLSLRATSENKSQCIFLLPHPSLSTPMNCYFLPVAVIVTYFSLMHLSYFTIFKVIIIL